MLLIALALLFLAGAAVVTGGLLVAELLNAKAPDSWLARQLDRLYDWMVR